MAGETQRTNIPLRLVHCLLFLSLATCTDANTTVVDDAPTTASAVTENPSNATGQFEVTRSLSTQDILDCLNANVSVLHVSAQEVTVSYSQRNHTRMDTKINEARDCLLHVMASEGSVLYVRFLEQTCKGNNSVSVNDSSYSATWSGCESVLDLPSDFITSGHVASVRMTIGHGGEPYSLRMAIQAMPQPGKPELELRYLSPKQGYIQTPGLPPGTGREYPPLEESWVQVAVPSDHVVLVSFVYMFLRVDGYGRCRVETLELLTGERSEGNVVWSGCASLTPFPTVYEADVLHVHFSGDLTLDRSKGFRLLFSFHERDAAPERLDSGLWNCSVPHWPDFELHFLCNLETECAAGEDEATCPYTNSACGQGRISAGRGCYSLGHPSLDSTMSWNQANMECMKLGGQLASLNTPQELHDVTEVILSRKPMEVFVGLKSTPASLPQGYKYAYQWEDNTIAYFAQPDLRINKEPPSCGYLSAEDIKLYYCDYPDNAYYLCEMNPVSGIDGTGTTDTGAADETEIQFSTPSSLAVDGITGVRCSGGHLTHAFLACDVQTSCWAGGYVSGDDVHGVPSSSACPAPLTSLPPSFTCASGGGRVPYSLVCDHRQDCQDGSDEELCVFPTCTGSTPLQCGDQQCVSLGALCDGQEQCVDGADEVLCDKLTLYTTITSQPPPAAILFDGRGSYNYSQLPAGSQCPETHFQCPGDGYCLPVFVRCNGVYDCPGKEDEAACDSYTCPGFYRCRASAICLHPQHVCDGVYQCPQQDDELFCDLGCPEYCMCHGLAFVCKGFFPAKSFPHLRYLDAAGSGLTPRNLSTNTMLIHLSLSNCGLTDLDNVEFPNLRSLNLSDNFIQVVGISHLERMPNLQELILSGNPITSLFEKDWGVDMFFPRLQRLDLSRVESPDFDANSFPFPNLQVLNLEGSRIERVAPGGFRTFSKLRALDLRGCPMTQFPQDALQGLDRLNTVFADNYKLCCPATLPKGFNLNNCQAPSNEISSCDALLRSDLYRVFLSVFAGLSLAGNLGSFVVRVFVQKSALRSGFGVFVTSLCVSDFLMGVYLAIIGVADRVYMGTYLWEDTSWRNSAACKTAGFFSLVSNEVSAFIICLITLDRFLVLRFPFSNLCFKKGSALIASAVVWLFGLVVATVPLVMGSQWEFYSQNGICLPLPITRNDFPGHDYAFGVMIVLNFVLFLLIAAGQASIYASIRANSMSASSTSKKSQDLSIARRLITIAVSDFLCWFPIGLLGLLASQGTPVPGEVNVSMAIFVLPLNSALNPFLYTLNTILERRQRAQEETLLKSITSQGSLKSTKITTEG